VALQVGLDLPLHQHNQYTKHHLLFRDKRKRKMNYHQQHHQPSVEEDEEKVERKNQKEVVDAEALLIFQVEDAREEKVVKVVKVVKEKNHENAVVRVPFF
jgi:hypothetical protein